LGSRQHGVEQISFPELACPSFKETFDFYTYKGTHSHVWISENQKKLIIYSLHFTLVAIMENFYITIEAREEKVEELSDLFKEYDPKL
jgi:hypothetical protein